MGSDDKKSRYTTARDYLEWIMRKQGYKPVDLESSDAESSIELNSKGKPFYSEELDIANQAWKALYADGGYTPKKGHKDQIMAWLKKRFPDLSTAAKDRISTIVNPNKQGGTPSSG